MFCGNCGSKIEDGSRFCGNCGASSVQQNYQNTANPQWVNIQTTNTAPKLSRKKPTAVILAVVIGLVIIGIYLIFIKDSVNRAFNGTWGDEGGKIVLNNGSFLVIIEDIELMKGTYSTNGNTMTTANVQISGAFLIHSEPEYKEWGFSSTQWYTEQQYLTLLEKYIVNELIADGMSQSEAKAEYDYFLEVSEDMRAFKDVFKSTWTLNDNTLTGTILGETGVLTKQGASPQTQGAPNIQAAIDVNIDTLLREIENNKARADQFYNGKTIRISGRIYAIYDDSLSLEGNHYDNIHVYFNASERSKILKLQKGQTVTVIGVYERGIFSSVRRAVIE